MEIEENFPDICRLDIIEIAGVNIRGPSSFFSGAKKHKMLQWDV